MDQDSSFALAHYRLALATDWLGRDRTVAHRAARRAVELADDLPERDRRFLRAYRAYVTGDADEGERLYRLLLQSHPDDAEAWFMLGEVLLHHNAVHGRPLTEAREPFRRARQVDPTFLEPIVHLVHLALLERDTARLDSLREKLDENFPYGLEAIYRATRGDTASDDVESAFRPLQSMDPAHALVAVHGLAMWDADAAYEAVRPWTTADRPDELRASALLMQADLLTMRGRLEAARQKLEVLAPYDSAAYWTGRGRLASLSYLPESEDRARERDEVRRGLRAWNAERVPERVVAVYLAPAEVYPAGRLYLLGLLQAEGGEADEALRTANRLESMEPSLIGPSGPTDFARSVRAEMARQGNQPEEALSHLEAVENRTDPLLLMLRLHSGARERYLRAELLVHLGRPEEALRWYRSLTGAWWGERAYVASAHLGRARVLEELGRKEEAVEAYRRFVELWQDADSALQPKVEEARDRLARLVGSPDLENPTTVADSGRP